MIVAVLGLTGGVAQDAERQLIVYVDVFEGNSFDSISELDGLTEEILTALHTAFADVPFDVAFIASRAVIEEQLSIFVDDAAYPEIFLPNSPTMAVQIRTFGEAVSFSVTPWAAYRNPPLPAGTYDSTVLMNYGGDNSLTLNQLTQISLGVGGYIARDCDFALPYINNTLADADLLAANTAQMETPIIQYSMHFYRAGCAYRQGNVDSAIADYLTILDVFATTEDQESYWIDATTTNLAWSYADQGDSDAAVTTLDGLRVENYTEDFLRGDSVNNMLWRIMLYAEVSEYQTALVQFIRMLDRAEDPFGLGSDLIARIYAERGFVHAAQGEADFAFGDYATAIETDPTYAKTYYYRGLLHEAQGDTESAVADFATYIATYDRTTFAAQYDVDATPYLTYAQLAAAMG